MKVVLITGAHGTIGKILCSRLKGYKILAHDYKGRLQISGDFSTDQGVEQCVNQVLSHTNDLYAIIHTVGEYYEGSLKATDEVIWRALFQNNVMSAVKLSKLLSPKVFIAFGVEGLLLGARINPAYVSVKCALMSFIKSLALTGTYANMISPSSVEGSEFMRPGINVKSNEISDLVDTLLKDTSIIGQIIDIPPRIS